MQRFIVGLLAAGICQVALASDLIEDVQALSEQTTGKVVNVTSAVQLHIANGAEWSQVARDLTEDGFTCKARTPRPVDASLVIYDCDIDLRHWYLLGFGNKVKIDVTVQNGKVVDAGGYTTFQGVGL